MPLRLKSGIVRMFIISTLLAALAFAISGCGPPNPPPTTSQWAISSTPAGARVFIDGGDAAFVTPCQVNLEPGLHMVELWKDGFERWSQQIYVTAGKAGALEAKLVRIPLYPVAVTLYDPSKTRSVAWYRKIEPALSSRILNARIAASRSYNQSKLPFPFPGPPTRQPRNAPTRSGGSVLTLLQWKACADPTVSYYKIERSIDMVNFGEVEYLYLPHSDTLITGGIVRVNQLEDPAYPDAWDASPGLSPSVSRYFYRIKAYGPSSRAYLTVSEIAETDPLPLVTPVAPQNESVVTQPNPTFEWYIASPASYFDVGVYDALEAIWVSDLATQYSAPYGGPPLLPGRQYYWDTWGYRVSNDVVTAVSMSQEWSFTMTSSSPSADTTSPAVSITSPANGQVLTGPTTITAKATDASGISRVDFFVDGQKTAAKTAPDIPGGNTYSTGWTPTAGAHAITVTAYDGAVPANSASTTINVTGPGSTGGTAEWTIMIYLNGDNDLESAALKDMNEMEMVGSTSSVNVLVQLDQLHTRGVKRYRVAKDTSPSVITSPVLQSLDELDMGNPDTLKDFLKWGVANYPAERYMAVIWNHGAGWRSTPGSPFRGISVDDTSGQILNMKELQMALEGVLAPGQKFDLVGFDACLMGMLEVGYQIRNQALYMVASEESEPGDGWPYDLWLDYLKTTPSATGAQVATRIVNDYASFYGEGSNTTQSAIDLTQMEAVADATDDLGAALVALMPGAGSTVSVAYGQTQPYYFDDYRDLYHFAEKIHEQLEDSTVRNAATMVKNAVANAVISDFHTNDAMANSHGLSVWLPTATPYYEGFSTYSQLDFAMRAGTGWSDFVSSFATWTPPLSSDKVTLAWSNMNGSNVDFDLYIQEPNGNWYCAYDGLETPNGSFDRDAPGDGGTSETYTWRTGAASGNYYVAVYFYKDWNGILATSPPASVTITLGGQTWTTAVPVGMAPGDYVFLDSPLVKSSTSLRLLGKPYARSGRFGDLGVKEKEQLFLW